MNRVLTALVLVTAAWLALSIVTFRYLGLLWALVTTIPFVPFLYAIVREIGAPEPDAT